MRGIAKNDTIYTPCDGVIINLRKGQSVEIDDSFPQRYWLIVNESCRIELHKQDISRNFLIF